MCYVFFFFFLQAEDGIRDLTVTGVQTCALPIWGEWLARWWGGRGWRIPSFGGGQAPDRRRREITPSGSSAPRNRQRPSGEQRYSIGSMGTSWAFSAGSVARTRSPTA